MKNTYFCSICGSDIDPDTRKRIDNKGELLKFCRMCQGFVSVSKKKEVVQ